MVKPQPLFLNWERDATEGMVTLVLKWLGFSLESRELKKQMFQFINHSFCLIISICCIHWRNPTSSWMVREHGMVVPKVQSPGTPVQVECASGREQTEYPAQRSLQINSDLICHLLWSYPSVSISVFLVTQSCLTLCDSMDCSLPGSSIHGIFQARILGWVAMPSSRGSSQPRDRTQLSIVYRLSHQGSHLLLFRFLQVQIILELKFPFTARIQH